MPSEHERIQLKKPTTIQQQINLLLSRGMIIEDIEQAQLVLKRISYYRLTAYGLSLKEEGTENYKSGTKSQHMNRLYEFDSKLRALFRDFFSHTINIYICP